MWLERESSEDMCESFWNEAEQESMGPKAEIGLQPKYCLVARLFLVKSIGQYI